MRRYSDSAKGSTFDAGGNVTTRTSTATTTAVASNLEGDSVSITAGQDLTVKGANVLADQAVDLSAVRNVNIEAAQNTQSSTSFNETKKSGLFSSGGLSLTIGKQQQSLDQGLQQTTAAASTLGSTGGNVTINAGGAFTQTGSDVITPKGDIAITAQKVDITEARETGSQSTEQKFKQSGLTVAITSPVLSALQTASSQLQAAGNTSSGRMQALAGANAAFNLKQGADAIKAGQGDANGMVKDAKGNLVEGNAADKAGGVGISISLGASSSQSKQNSSADNARGSSVTAGGNVTIQATGDGQGSNLTVQGSNVQAAGTTTLKADKQVNLLAAQNTSTESSSSKNASGSIGLGMQLGAGGAQVGVTVSAAAGKGQGAGNGVTYTNTQVAGNTVNIESGGDTTLKGAVVKANEVTAKVGGNLNIESLQDTNRYNEKSQQVGGSVTFGPAAGGSLNLAASKINSNYQSVGEQSAIRAGDGGFQVEVKGNTTLTGGQITSTQAAIDNSKNSFQTGGTLTTTDLQNTASYSAQSASVGVGTSGGKVAPSGAGIGSDKGSASSTSTAGISGVAGNTQARTGDKETGIGQIFDKDKVKAEVNAQVAITSEFGKQASKAVGDYAKTQYDKAVAEKDQAGIDAWKEGGTNRVALHAVVGGLTGGASGAVGAAAASAAAPTIDQLQGQLQSKLETAGLSPEAAKALSGVVGGGAAAAVGAAASGGSTAGAATAFNADMNNRQLHPSEVQWIKSNSKKFAADLSKALGREVSEAEAARWLTAAGESDVDVGMQRSNGQFVRGTSNSEEAQAYDAAKSFISSKAKANFIDASGQTQTLFTAKNGDFYKPEVYSQYRNDAAYRDFYWNTMGINLKGDQLTPQEQALYDQRQAIVNKQTVKDLVVLGGIALAGKTAINSSSLKSSIAQEREINEGVYKKISEIPKGQKPAPETYLSENYINTHLQDFRDSGVVRFTSESALKKYGTAGPDGGFVFPKNQFDSLLSQSNGNLSVVEQKLGLPAGYLSAGDTVAIHIKPNDLKGLRIPSGNESGALPAEWIPGGYTKGGVPEAVMDFGYKPPVTILRINGVGK